MIRLKDSPIDGIIVSQFFFSPHENYTFSILLRHFLLAIVLVLAHCTYPMRVLVVIVVVVVVVVKVPTSCGGRGGGGGPVV